MPLKRQLRIFLLYARRDGEAVRHLYRRLVREGADVWFDQTRLSPGQDWAHEIHGAIHRSDVVIACLSRQFNKQGGYRHEELRIALDRGVFLIPARLERCEMPAPLLRLHRVDLFESKGYGQLLRALKRLTG